MVENKQQRNEPEPENLAGMKEKNKDVETKDATQAPSEEDAE